jgi:type IX secretion system PorP/SprF family membrane protein
MSATNVQHHAMRKLSAVVAALIILTAAAQQDPMYSMYMWNMMAIQPGYAGSADVLNATALSRIQWAAIEGAPTTQSLSVHSPLNAQTLGLGGSLVHDRIGRTYTTSAFADIAYRMRVSRGTRLALGLNAGINHAYVANSKVENTDPNDPTFQADISGRICPNFGFGAYLWSTKGYVGLSAPKLLRNYLGRYSQDGISSQFIQESTHVFLTAGYVFPIGTVKLKPSIMLKASEGAPLSGDVSATVFLQDKFILGAAYRYGDSFTGILALQATNQIRVGYAYDMGISQLNRRANGTHEVMVSYAPVFTRDKIRSPRYF